MNSYSNMQIKNASIIKNRAVPVDKLTSKSKSNGRQMLISDQDV